MTFDQFLYLMAAVVFGMICLAFTIGYYCGREDTTDPANWHRVPEENPYREEVDDRFDRLMAAWLSEEEPGELEYLEDDYYDDQNPPPSSREAVELGAEPLDAITFGGLLAAPHQPRHERLASTGELRALAYAGDMDTINREVDQFVAGLSEGDDL